MSHNPTPSTTKNSTPSMLRPYVEATVHKSIIDHATDAPFLTHAGNGTLTPAQLSYYLSQDLHYTRSYVKFAAGLLSLVAFPVRTNNGARGGPASDQEVATGNGVEDRKVLEGVVDLLLGSLNNVRREQRFFGEVVREYDLLLLRASGVGGHGDGGEGSTTKTGLDGVPVSEVMERYCTFLEGWAVDGYMHGPRMEDGKDEAVGWRERLWLGLVVLWAMEWCYYLGWSGARAGMQRGEAEESQGGEGLKGRNSAATRALREKLIPNWTSGEFLDFVGECGKAVEEVGDMLGLEQNEMLRKKAEDVFERVLRLEAEFWEDAETGGVASGG